MQNSSVRPTDVLEKILSTYGSLLFRYALIMLGNAADAEDVVQDTLLKYWQKLPEFRDKDHERAWLLTVTANRCRDILRFHKHHPVVELEQIMAYVGEADTSSDSGILEALMKLP